MKTHEAELQRIKDLLHNNPKGMKITRIAGELAMNRNACAKFVEILLMTGQVEQIEHCMSKIIILSRRTGIPTMLDRSEDFIIILDRDMKIIRVNENYLKFTGIQQENLLGKRADSVFLPVAGSRLILDKIRKARFNEDIRTKVKEVSGGKEFFFDVRMTPTVFNDGTKGMTILIEDITRDKKTLAAIEDESRKLVEGILSCIDDAVILLDSRTGATLFANPAAVKMFGGSPSESVGKDPGFFQGITTMIPGYPGKLQDAFRDRKCYEAILRVKPDGSEEIPVNLVLRPICNDSGEVKNIVMVIRDIAGNSQNNGDTIQQELKDPVTLPFSPVKTSVPDGFKPT